LPVWFSYVVQKQTFGEVGTKMVIRWQVVSKCLHQNLLESVSTSWSHNL